MLAKCKGPYLMSQQTTEDFIVIVISVQHHSILQQLWCEYYQQGKSEGFDNCDQPSKFAYNWIKIINFSVHVTLKFDGWPWNTIEHLFCTTSSFVHHFKPIGEFKVELQSRNAQFG